MVWQCEGEQPGRGEASGVMRSGLVTTERLGAREASPCVMLLDGSAA